MHMEKSIRHSGAAAAGRAYRQYARQWLRAKLPEHIPQRTTSNYRSTLAGRVPRLGGVDAPGRAWWA